MNGMKSGSGDDPFADDTDDQDDVVDETADAGAEESAVATGPVDVEPADEQPLPGVPDHPADGDAQLPWIHRRDGVKDGRTPKTIHYTEHTTKRERRQLQPALEEALGEDVELTDLREAAYLVGMDHVDEVAEQLREWGYAVE